MKLTRMLMSVFLAFPLPAQALDLKELVRQVEIQYTGNSSFALVSMEIRTEHWQRRLEMESWSLGRDYFLTRITSPAKEKGVATLKANNDVWNYLPKVDRVIKIPASMMGGSWMGSHITNDDLVKGSQVDQDYRFELIEETDTGYHIECLPYPEAAVVWGKLRYRISKPDNLPVSIDYFDEDMVPVRQITFDEVETIDDRTLPLRMTVTPLDHPEEQTIIRYKEIEFDTQLAKNYFSLRNLKKR